LANLSTAGLKVFINKNARIFSWTLFIYTEGQGQDGKFCEVKSDLQEQFGWVIIRHHKRKLGPNKNGFFRVPLACRYFLTFMGENHQGYCSPSMR
jgi:aromatic ring-cleaving dioxygenase